jgi:hypothetical protein
MADCRRARAVQEAKVKYEAISPARADGRNSHTDWVIGHADSVDAVKIGQMFRA